MNRVVRFKAAQRAAWARDPKVQERRRQILKGGGQGWMGAKRQDYRPPVSRIKRLGFLKDPTPLAE
jgi:hypothetical protein